MAKILLVDDDVDLAETLGELFEMMDYQVKVVSDGQSALATLKNERFDLVLLDWQLPDMSGLEVCKSYRESGGQDRVLMLSGMRDAGSREAGKAAGADDFLTKPFSVDQLTDRMKALL